MSTIEQFLKPAQLDVAVSTRAAAATALSNATWPDALAAKLANAAQETNPILDSPSAITLGTPQLAIAPVNGEAVFPLVYGSVSGQAVTTSSTFVNVLSVTGAGVLELVAFYLSSSITYYVEIVIDGVTVYSGSITADATEYRAKCPVGAITLAYNGSIKTFSIAALSAIPFKTSLLIRHRVSSTTANTAGVVWKHRVN